MILGVLYNDLIHWWPQWRRGSDGATAMRPTLGRDLSSGEAAQTEI
jgi:hypothetical protein